MKKLEDVNSLIDKRFDQLNFKKVDESSIKNKINDE